MLKLKIARVIAVLSIIVGCVVMVGWYLDSTLLTSIIPGWIRMKFATALCFVFSGIIVYFLAFGKEEMKETRQIVLTIFPMFLVLVMGTLFLGSVLGFQTGMENITFVDVHELKTPIFQGRPSVATMAAFLLIAGIGLLFNFNKSTGKTLSLVGLIVGIIGGIGIVGYMINQPFLYYEIVGFSNAIAANTTVLFALLGLALFFIDDEMNKSNAA